jgi:DNA-directed RNA polymerase specialized sigma24 family protein
MTFYSAHGSTRERADTRRAGAGGDELARIYAEHSRGLLKLAALLVPDVSAAQEVLYEAFAALDHQCGLRRPDEVLAFLRRAVVCRARAVAARIDRVSAGAGVSGISEGAVISALRALPDCQREALVLRYYGQLSDEQAAAAMGVRPAALRDNVASGMTALRGVLVS